MNWLVNTDQGIHCSYSVLLVFIGSIKTIAKSIHCTDFCEAKNILTLPDAYKLKEFTADNFKFEENGKSSPN